MYGHSSKPFHFQPHEDQEFSQTDNAPLLFTSKPALRMGGVTLFFRTRRSLRQRLGVHDPGELEGMLAEPATPPQDHRLQDALNRVSRYRYLFADTTQEEETNFSNLLAEALAS